MPSNIVHKNSHIHLAAAGLSGAMGMPGAAGLPMSGAAGSSQQEQYLAAAQAAAAAAVTGNTSMVQGQGQSTGVSVPLLPYPYGTAGVPWGAVYNPIAAAQAAANLVQQQQQQQMNGGATLSQSGSISTPPGNITNGRRPPTPTIQTAGPPTPGPPSDSSTPASGAAGPNASPNTPYIIPAFIDPSSGQLVRFGGGAGQMPAPGAPVRLMGPAHPGPHGQAASAQLLMGNQQQVQQQQLAANLAALAASNPAAAAAAAQGFPASVALLNQQPNNLGIGGPGGNNSSNISSLGSPSIGSLSGIIKCRYLLLF